MSKDKDRNYIQNMIKMRYPSAPNAVIDEMVYLADKFKLDAVSGDIVMLGFGNNFRPYVTYHGLMRIMTNAKRDMEVDFEVIEDTEAVFSVKCILRVPPPHYKSRVEYYKDMLSLGLTYDQARAEITSSGYERLVKKSIKDHMRKYYVVLGKKQAFKDAFNFTSHKILSDVVPIDFGILDDDTDDVMYTTTQESEVKETHKVKNTEPPKSTYIVDNLKVFVNKVSSFIGYPISSEQKKKIFKEFTGNDSWKKITKNQSESMLTITKTTEGLNKIKGIIETPPKQDETKPILPGLNEHNKEDDDEHNKEKMITRSAKNDDDDTQPRKGDVNVAKKLKYVMDTISSEVGRELTKSEKVYILKTVFRIKDWRQITIQEADEMVSTVEDSFTMKAIVALVKDCK